MRTNGAFAVCAAIALYNPAEHRSLATRFGQDARISALAPRPLPLWGVAMCNQGSALALTGKSAEAINMITAGAALKTTAGQTHLTPHHISALAGAHLDLNHFDEARRCISEALTAAEITKEKWYEAEVNRIAGEIARNSAEPDAAKAQTYFQRALSIARQQQAKSWELRAAMSLARLWREQGKAQQARELLAPVYGWFTEGFDTRDLKEAKTLLEELA
jgi:predicted ATPase